MIDFSDFIAPHTYDFIGKQKPPIFYDRQDSKIIHKCDKLFITQKSCDDKAQSANFWSLLCENVEIHCVPFDIACFVSFCVGFYAVIVA